MKKSEQTKEIFSALAEVNKEIKNPFNSADNPFYKSKYAPLDDVLNLVRPILAKHGLAFSQSPVSKEGAVALLVGVEGLLTHTSGQWVEYEPFYLPLNKGTAQDAGSCITYARRYQLTAVFDIAGDNDDDGNSVSDKKETLAPKTPDAKPEVKPIKCEVCSKAIEKTETKSVFQVSQGTKNLTGKSMCLACFRKWESEQHTEA
jgi:hypothetical protein